MELKTFQQEYFNSVFELANIALGKNYLSSFYLKKYKTIIFINGCFWHHHSGCPRAKWPKSNTEYWIPKIEKNIIRDKDNIRELKKLGWNVEIIWECETNVKELKEKLIKITKKMNTRLNK